MCSSHIKSPGFRMRQFYLQVRMKQKLTSPQVFSGSLQRYYLFPVVTDNQTSYCIKHVYRLESCSASAQPKIFTCAVDKLADYKRTTSLTIFTEGERNIGIVVTVPVCCLFFRLFGWFECLICLLIQRHYLRGQSVRDWTSMGQFCYRVW